MTVALFPARCQPPHIGHILTLMRLYPLYDEIIIAVSTYTFDGEKPHIIEPREVVEILREIFRFLPKFKVIGPGPGFNERTHLGGYPDFDELITGDPTVAQHAKELRVKHVFVPPSTIGGMEIHSTLVRKALNDVYRR